MNRFSEELIRLLQEKLGEKAQVEAEHVKPNLTSASAITIHNSGSNIARTIYLEGYYAMFCNGIAMRNAVHLK